MHCTLSRAIILRAIMLLAVMLLALGVMLAFPDRSHADADHNPFQELVFDTPWLKSMTPPFSLRYHYTRKTARREGQGEIAPQLKPMSDTIALVVGTPSAEATFNVVTYEIFTGKGQRVLGPYHDVNGNPVSIIFLERDAYELRRHALSGSRLNTAVLRNVIRRSFARVRTAREVTFSHAGKDYQGKKIEVRSFDQDHLPPPLVSLKDKTYTFIVSPHIPGGIYSITTRTPDPKDSKRILYEDTLVFMGMER